MRSYKGFTLIEMILVVLILGIVYGLMINIVQHDSKKAENKISLFNLPLALADQFSGRQVSLICTDHCRDCGLYESNERITTIEGLMQEPVKSYRYDNRYGIAEIEWSPLFKKSGDEENICFRFDMDRLGKGSRMLLLYQDEVIVYEGYLGSVKRFASFQEAIGEREVLYNRALQ
jgi:prepilin-type N-terminal cleavage/methylation domain-containing protein